MKTSSDPRHRKRIKLVQALYASTFNSRPSALAKPILEHLTGIDRQISVAAPEWPLDKINRVDLAILRVAAYELFHSDTPKKVVIDEAVEIAKAYGSDASPSFVNGVLGTILAKKQAQHD